MGAFGVYMNLPDNDIEVEVEYTYDPGEPDQWYDSNGDPGTPGTAPSIEILHIWAELPNEGLKLTAVDIVDIIPSNWADEIETEILENHHE